MIGLLRDRSASTWKARKSASISTGRGRSWRRYSVPAPARPGRRRPPTLPPPDVKATQWVPASRVRQNPSSAAEGSVAAGLGCFAHRDDEFVFLRRGKGNAGAIIPGSAVPLCNDRIERRHPIPFEFSATARVGSRTKKTSARARPEKRTALPGIRTSSMPCVSLGLTWPMSNRRSVVATTRKKSFTRSENPLLAAAPAG
jgi:hypothetical protein